MSETKAGRNRHSEVVEHHYDYRAPEGKRSYEMPAGTTTSARRTVEQLAVRRAAGDMPDTLSHWTVGKSRVVGQSADTLWRRQGMDEAPDDAAP